MFTMRRGFLMLSFAIALCFITVTGCGKNPEQGKSQEEKSTEATKQLEITDIENNEQILLDNDACTISFSGIESALTEEEGQKEISSTQEETSEEPDNSTLAEIEFETVPIETRRSEIKSTENNFIIKIDMEKKMRNSPYMQHL